MTDHPTTDPAAWADGYLHGIADADQRAAENTTITPCTCGVMTGGARDPRPNCEVHGGQ